MSLQMHKPKAKISNLHVCSNFDEILAKTGYQISRAGAEILCIPIAVD